VGDPHFSCLESNFLWEKSKEMRNEFTLAFNEVLEEKGLPREIIIKALEFSYGFCLPPVGKCINCSNN